MEIWFKNRKIKQKDWKILLKNPGMEISIFKKGILVTALKNKWRKILLIIQKFITYEGRFGNMLFYHAHFIINFIDGIEINFPYFLLYSLKKVATNIQRKIQPIDSALHHYRLVKHLIEDHFRSKGNNWEVFLFEIILRKLSKDEPTSKIRRSRRKFPSNPELQNKDLLTNELPQDEHTQKYYDDENILSNVSNNLINKKSVSTDEGPSIDGTKQHKISNKKCALTTEKPSRRSTQLMEWAIK